MIRIALLSCLLVACGADREVVPSGSPDVGLEEGIALDSAADGNLADSGPDLLTVEPRNRTVTINTTTPDPIDYSVMFEAANVTATSVFALDDPANGAFNKNVLTITTPLPFSGVGKTLVVTARDAGKKGRAKLTLVRLGTDDFLFQSPHGVSPTPDKELFKVTLSSAADGVGAQVSVVLKNDPGNPAGVDARKFVKIRAMQEGFAKLAPPSCDPGQATTDTDGDGTHDAFVASSMPRTLCFDVRPVTNVVVTAAESASFHRVLVDVVTSTGKTLQSRSIVVMVPATDPVPR